MNPDHKPWWFPEKVNREYYDRLRADYPDKGHWTDEQLNEYFNEYGRKYVVLWDHLGDAYEEYEQLANAYLNLYERLKQLEK